MMTLDTETFLYPKPIWKSTTYLQVFIKFDLTYALQYAFSSPHSPRAMLETILHKANASLEGQFSIWSVLLITLGNWCSLIPRYCNDNCLADLSKFSHST